MSETNPTHVVRNQTPLAPNDNPRMKITIVALNDGSFKWESRKYPLGTPNQRDKAYPSRLEIDKDVLAFVKQLRERDPYIQVSVVGPTGEESTL